MKKSFTTLAFVISFYSFGQVGINTQTPKVTLDIVASPLDPAKIDGLMAPRLTGNELKAKDALYLANQTGTIVYITQAASPTTTKTINVTTAGYYYFDGAVWQKIISVTTEPWYNQSTNTEATSNTQNIYQMGNVGINTTTPVARLNVRGTDNQPSISGTATNASVRVEGSTNHVLDIGTLSNSPWGSYLQSVDKSNLANGLPLVLNPNSGNVGINTFNPTEKLDIGSGNVRVRNITSNAGESTDKIVVADTNGVLKTLPNTISIGDIKSGFQTADHSGWVKLDGRLTSSLSASQQTSATSLGFGTNLPNATNSYLVQNGTALGSVSNSNVRTIQRNQLPNVALSGTTDSRQPTIEYKIWNNGASTATGGSTELLAALKGSGSYTNFTTGDVQQNAHSHTFNTESINGGVSQQTLNIQPQSMSVNIFVYLGL